MPNPQCGGDAFRYMDIMQPLRLRDYALLDGGNFYYRASANAATAGAEASSALRLNADLS